MAAVTSCKNTAFATSETSGKLVRVNFHKDFWDMEKSWPIADRRVRSNASSFLKWRTGHYILRVNSMRKKVGENFSFLKWLGCNIKIKTNKGVSFKQNWCTVERKGGGRGWLKS